MKNKKILVTGGAGYIGSHCIIALIESGYQPIVIDNFCSSSKSVFQKLEQITKEKIKYYHFDLRDKKKLNHIFKQYSFQSVIHFAGLKSVSESSKDPLLYFNNNISSSISLLECMKENKVFKLIFSSSACVYNDDEPLPWSETTKAGKTTNPYGTSKYIIERILMDVAKSDPKWQIGIARYFNPIGNHSSGLIGDNPKGVPNNLVPYITKVIKGELPYLNIYGNDYKTKDGTGVRDYIHVMDLADAHIKILKNFKNIKDCEIYNFGSGKGYSVKDIIHAFETNNKITIPRKIKDKRNGDLAVYYTRNKKAKSKLNFKIKRDLKQIVKDVYKFI